MIDTLTNLEGNAFQEFCSTLLSLCYPDFQAVDGSGGDGGNDGFRVVDNTVFQMYAPAKRDMRRMRTKIDHAVDDAARLRSTGLPRLTRLVFLTPFDLTPEQHEHLRSAGERCAVPVESWGESKLRALVAEHPMVRQMVPELLLPDVVQEIRELRAEVADGVSALHTALHAPVAETGDDDILGPYFYPDLYVLQKSETAGGQDHRAFEYFRIRVYGDALRRGGFEPEAEDGFLSLVKDCFTEDAGAQLEDPTHELVQVQNVGLDLTCHRRWCWAGMGAIGMAATLRDLSRPGAYSAADIACDMVRLLVLVSNVVRQGDVRVVIEVEANRLRPAWDLSDQRAVGTPAGTLAGIQGPGKPCAEYNPPLVRLEWDGDAASLVPHAHEIVGEALVHVARRVHRARVSAPAFIGSIPAVIRELERVRRL